MRLRALGWMAAGILILLLPVSWQRLIEARRDAQRIGTTSRLAQLKLALHNYRVESGSDLDLFDPTQGWAERLLPHYNPGYPETPDDPEIAPSRFRIPDETCDPSWTSMVLVELSESPQPSTAASPQRDRTWAIFAVHDSGIDWRLTPSVRYVDVKPRLERELDEHGYVAFLTSNGLVGAFTPYGIRLSFEHFPELVRLENRETAE